MAVADNLKRISLLVDLADGGKGYVVIDSTYANSSVGGLRIAEDISPEEVSVLAREMTLKYAFIGLPRGGAKGGLKIPVSCTADQKQKLLFQFGQCIGPLIWKGIYYPWMDINCNQADLKTLYQGAGLTSSPSTDSSYFTAMSTHASLDACRDFLGCPSRPLHLAIEGFGNVASSLVRRLPADQYLVTAVSTLKGAVKNELGFDARELVEKKHLFGDEFVRHLKGEMVKPDEVLTDDVDILLPSARIWTISNKIASEMRARFVVPIANAPYGEGAVDILETKKCICLPAFVVNSGGVFGSTLCDDGVPSSKVEKVTMTYFKAIIRAFLTARSEFGTSSCVLSEKLSLERLSGRVDAFSRRSPYLWAAKNLVQNYLVPKSISWRHNLDRFTTNLIELEQLITERGCDPYLENPNFKGTLWT